MVDTGALSEAVQAFARHVRPGMKLAVAVSGGRDSMALLHLTVALCPHCEISVVHVDHGLRPRSRQDADFVKAAAEKLGLGFTLHAADVGALARDSGRSVETEGRLLRRDIYRTLLEGGCDLVLLGHHRGDQTESVLMHVFRGCAVRGLVGMRESAEGIFRPLLACTRSQIDRFVADNGIAFVEDDTNADSRFARNFVRNELLPAVRSRWAVDDGVAALSAAAAEDEAYFRSVMREGVTWSDGAACLPVDCFTAHPALSGRYVLKALSALGVGEGVERRHIEAVRQLAEKQNGAAADLPDSVTACREYDRIAFFRRRPCGEDEQPFGPGMIMLRYGVLTVSACDPVPRAGELRFDLDRVGAAAVIRSRREGDLFCPYGGGTKKFKEYLIDKKIARRLRDLPVVAEGNRILIAVGLEISDEIKLTDRTVNAAVIHYTEDENL